MLWGWKPLPILLYLVTFTCAIHFKQSGYCWSFYRNWILIKMKSFKCHGTDGDFWAVAAMNEESEMLGFLILPSSATEGRYCTWSFFSLKWGAGFWKLHILLPFLLVKRLLNNYTLIWMSTRIESGFKKGSFGPVFRDASQLVLLRFIIFAVSLFAWPCCAPY